jgi:hypothetical protein
VPVDDVVEASGFEAELVVVVLAGLVTALEGAWVTFELAAVEPAAPPLPACAGREGARPAA